MNLSPGRLRKKTAKGHCKPMRFLLIEDNKELGRAVQERLSLDGHAVDWVMRISEADAYLEGAPYDLILLDIMFPDGDGRDFLRHHRQQNRKTPVVVLTARSEVSDRVHLLDLGADDYITKPFDFSEMEARCRAVLRRQGGAARNEQRFGDLVFDPLAATLTVGSDVRELRNRELRLMEIFFASPERIFPKSLLVDRLFSYAEDVNENAVEVYVGRLRKKINGSTVRIETLRGVGYRMTLI
jgi:two-component system, OmpR family, response regulator TctD